MARKVILSRKQKRKLGHVPTCPYCGHRDAWLAAGKWTCRNCAGDYTAMRESVRKGLGA